MDGFQLHFVKQEIEQNMKYGRVSKLSLPFSDMLILQIRKEGKNPRLLFALNPSLTRLHLTEENFENPKQAPAALMLFRKHLMGAELVDIVQPLGDRVLVFHFQGLNELGDSQHIFLYYEATGKHTNLSLVIDGKIIECLRHVGHGMSRLRLMLPGAEFIAPPVQDKMDLFDFSEEAFAQRFAFGEEYFYEALIESFCGLFRQSAQELALRMLGDTMAKNIGKEENGAEKIRKTVAGIEKDAHILFDAEEKALYALPFCYRSLQAEKIRHMPSYSSALEAFYHQRDLTDRMLQRSSALVKHLRQALQRAEKRIAISEESLLSEEKMQRLRVFGELLTAYIGGIPKGEKSVRLFNYYSGEEENIPLDEKKSPQQNAQHYFKQYKKAQTAKKLAAEQIVLAREEIEKIEEALYFLSILKSEEELAELRENLENEGILKKKIQNKKKEMRISKPMKFVFEDGTIILLGKNSKQNDRILKEARGDEIWLHAKDVPGSHVILKNSAPSNAQLAFALKLASFYSKNGGQGVEVDYTKRSNVKKIQGAGLGKVHFSGNRSLYIKSGAEEIRRMMAEEKIRQED